MPQSSNINGHNNIVVQAQGDGITVNLNQPHLSLVAWHRQQRKPEKVLDLLNPFVRAIPLVGRESAKAELESWLTSHPAISVRCLIGGGGTGKTRLAIELCESAEQNNWFAGFVTHKELTRFAGQQNLSNWGWPKDTLVVVDYAAARARVLHQWLVELAQNVPGAGKHLRLLLLERHADPGLGWWHDLVTPGTFSEEPIAALFDPVTPVALPPIAASNAIRDILAHVMTEASRLLGKTRVLKPPALGANSEFDRKLADPSVAFAPLYLSMAGVTAVQEGIPTLLTRGRAEMAQRIATDELARVEKLARDRNVNAELLKYLSVGVTLAGGYPRDDLIDCIVEERQALGYVQQDDQGVADAARDALGIQLERISPILPDLIGEAAILDQLAKLPKQKQNEFVTRWFARVRGPVAATLVRIAQDFAAAEDPLRWFDAIINANPDLDSLWEISNQLPQQTLRFRERSLKVAEAIVDRLRDEPARSTSLQELAIALNNLAVRLRDLGCLDKALAPAREAVKLYHELADAHSDAFRPDLASALSNLANELSELGRPHEALAPAQEAVDIRRKLAAQPGAPCSALADALDALGVTLRAARRWKEALAPAQEAVDIRRKSAPTQDAFRRALADSLTNLANTLNSLGRWKEALAPAQGAVDIHREVAAAQPDAFRPDLAASLNNLANTLNLLGQPEKALAPSQEGVKLFRELAVAQPDAFRPRLATSMCALADCLGQLSMSDDALRSNEEAVQALGPMFLSTPAPFAGLMAAVVSAYGLRLKSLNREPQPDLVDLLSQIIAILNPETPPRPSVQR